MNTMKLDLNGMPPSLQIAKAAATPTTTVQDADKDHDASSVAASSDTADRTTFQSGSTNVKALVDTALATPEVRQDKVDNLKQAITSGTWKFDAGKVADAMIAANKQS
jgi:flagellar biosynthesis anti-sigma factor FlgM